LLEREGQHLITDDVFFLDNGGEFRFRAIRHLVVVGVEELDVLR
jgi:hypothetical protein